MLYYLNILIFFRSSTNLGDVSPGLDGNHCHYQGVGLGLPPAIPEFIEFEGIECDYDTWVISNI